MDDKPLTQKQKDEVQALLKQYLQSAGFTTRKITDTPTDDLAVVPRKYVTMNGDTSSRPTASVVGQRYFDTDLNQPVWVGNGFAWVDATGTPA